MKKKVMVCALVLICLSVAAGSTLAYFTKDVVAHNVITTGGISIALNEWADADKTEAFPQDGIANVMPGSEVTKIVEVANTGENAAYVRISVEKAIELAGEGNEEINPQLIDLDINTEKWQLGTDGFYYYKEALAGGATTEPLFTTVTFKTEMGNPYQGCTVGINVTAQAVQAANNGSDPLTAQGWPVIAMPA